MRATIEKLAVVVGLIFALAGVILIWVAGAKYDRQLASLRQTQDELATVQTRRGTYQRLVQNLLVYSQSQPNIDALLVPFGFKQAAQPPGSQPAAPTPTAAPQAGGRR